VLYPFFFSANLDPFGDDVVEMLEDDPVDDSGVSGTHVVGVGFDCLKTFDIKPVLGFGTALSTMKVDRLASLVGLKEEAPAENEQDCRPAFPSPFPIS
jgi:hypothetical protein